MHAIWSGMISFGLVNIPVKIYAAARDIDVSFNQMHKDDSGRVRYAKLCKVCGKELSKEDIVKGYEYQKEQYVIITDKELAGVNLKTTKSISVTSFVDIKDIEPMEFEKAYYVAPDENGQKAYALLREALIQSKKIAIGKVSLHSREQLAALRIAGDAIILETMHFVDEMVKPEGIGIPAADFQVADSELDLAKILIEHMSAPFDYDAYHDEYEKALKELISHKIAGEEVTAAPTPQPTDVIDIMAALKASLESVDKQAPAEKEKSA
ncbi:MAG: non-homologous end joining protein Ku [Armatimonadota bacterium]